MRPVRLCSLALALCSFAGGAGAVELVSHRAAYRLGLAAGDDSGFADVRGALVIEWRATCEGSLSRQRLGFVASTGDGQGLTYDVRFSSWESPDRTRIRFALRSFDGTRLFEEFRGEAALDAPGSPGRAVYERPESSELALPAGTIFPTEQLERLIEDARAGRRIAQYTVFDGSGPDALNTVSASIGAPRKVELADGGVVGRWPVSLAYFDPRAAGDEPEFEIAFDLAESGVLYDVRLDYGAFVLTGELESLETFDTPACD